MRVATFLAAVLLGAPAFAECPNDVLQSYLWRDCATPTAELAGASTTDCGT